MSAPRQSYGLNLKKSLTKVHETNKVWTKIMEVNSIKYNIVKLFNKTLILNWKAGKP